MPRQTGNPAAQIHGDALVEFVVCSRDDSGMASQFPVASMNVEYPLFGARLNSKLAGMHARRTASYLNRVICFATKPPFSTEPHARIRSPILMSSMPICFLCFRS
jgi:hypothetical protein